MSNFSSPAKAHTRLGTLEPAVEQRAAVLQPGLTTFYERAGHSRELEPVPPAEVMTYFQGQEKAGMVKLVQKPVEVNKGKSRK